MDRRQGKWRGALTFAINCQLRLMTRSYIAEKRRRRLSGAGQRTQLKPLGPESKKGSCANQNRSPFVPGAFEFCGRLKHHGNPTKSTILSYVVDQELGATSMRLRTAGVTQPTQHSPRSFQRGPKWLGTQMHRALLARHKHHAIFVIPNVIYLPLGLFGKVNGEVRGPLLQANLQICRL
jgi:hypothetical protein